jgi:hypothetical protein
MVRSDALDNALFCDQCEAGSVHTPTAVTPCALCKGTGYRWSHPIYNVTVLESPRSNGSCTSFETKAAADNCAAWLRTQGVFSVHQWEC